MSLDTAPQTFAVYLAKHYIAKKGFSEGTVPEAGALSDACDIVLTGSDGMSFQIIGLVDREAHPEKRFSLSAAELDDIGKQCLKYAGKINGAQLPITIHVMEIANGRTSASSRLSDIKRQSLFSKCHLHAWSIDTSTATVWTNAPFKGRFLGRPWMEQLLKNPRASNTELQTPHAAIVEDPGKPIVTIGLMVLLAAIFGAELYFAVQPLSGLLNPDIQTLMALGGLNHHLVMQQGEWYRVLTAAFLHGGILHLVMNGIALYMAGSVLEALVGRAWFLALFFIGAIGGSLLSLAINPATVVSVGASGAIMGLLAAAFIASFRLTAVGGRSQVQISMMQMLIPSLLPLTFAHGGQQVDYAAHLGGALAGALAGFLLYKTWPRTNPLPQFRAIASAVTIAGVAVLAVAAVPLIKGYGGYALESHLITNAKLPKSTSEGKANAAALVAEFPRDPRSHYMQALAALDAKDMNGVERALRAGLKETEILKTKFSPKLEAEMRGLLALVLIDKGNPAEARAVAEASCATVDGTMKTHLVQQGVCR